MAASWRCAALVAPCAVVRSAGATWHAGSVRCIAQIGGVAPPNQKLSEDRVLSKIFESKYNCSLELDYYMVFSRSIGISRWIGSTWKVSNSSLLSWPPTPMNSDYHSLNLDTEWSHSIVLGSSNFVYLFIPQIPQDEVVSLFVQFLHYLFFHCTAQPRWNTTEASEGITACGTMERELKV